MLKTWLFGYSDYTLILCCRMKDVAFLVIICINFLAPASKTMETFQSMTKVIVEYLLLYCFC